MGFNVSGGGGKSGVFGTFQSGQYYGGALNGSTPVDRTLILNEVVGCPLVFPEILETNEISINVRGTATATLFRFYVMDSNADGTPKEIVYTSSNIAVTTTGLKQQSLNYTFEANKVYWIFGQVNGTLGLECQNQGACYNLGTYSGGAALFYSLRNIVAGFPILVTATLLSSIPFTASKSNITPINFKIKKA